MSLIDLTSTPLPRLAPRPADSHKGDFGRALLVGGSRGMGGAIALAGLAALRSGAGLVTLAVPRCIQDVVASFSPCYMTHGMEDEDGHVASDAWDNSFENAAPHTTIAIGPGMGRSEAAMNFVSFHYRMNEASCVFDADALFALAARTVDLASTRGPRILTPHPGEFGRLSGGSYDSQNRLEAVIEFLRKVSPRGRHPIVLVLKGHETIVADPQRYAINHTGNPGMATGGTGDVLTGVITALLCQGLSPFDAARLGVHVHGLAGDLAAEKLGQVSLIASDLLDFLPAAFQKLK
jgi:NAD(P)H-hydrate epimerase